ncbi:MAG: DUF3139 domain-containing protein [Ruminococcaceae bacterium]|nr:DUF3139 domain-containing protein [Oscillospiraceae bacterium]
MKKKILKVLALVLAIILIIGIGVFANALVGNPVSKYLATKSAKEHLEKNYSDKDFIIEEVTYDFKTGGYYARVTSPTSIDSHFSLSFDLMGNLIIDCYDDVTSGWNTAYRIGEEYRKEVDKVFENNEFPFFMHISYGDIEFTSEEYGEDSSRPDYAIYKETLEIDGIYDIDELGKKAGKLTVYIYDNDVTEENLAEILLNIKSVFDKSGVTFYAIDCVLEKSKPEASADGSVPKDPPRIEVLNFLYSDIYENDLMERVKDSNKKAIEYYEEQDKIKEQEISGQ